MPQTNVNIRIDAELKKDFDLFCKELGLTMTSAINIFVKKAVQEQRIPFELSLKTPNDETILAFKEAEQLLTSKNIKTYSSLREAVEEMEANNEL
ncbi:MAG: type II toxin-antitoxin system RelB/DinJ family antitoxin [Clostridiales bacterium]|nr:type II toxin-antitoxin system RelB/DinJ family antitoxin [Clostridiales bacterium]